MCLCVCEREKESVCFNSLKLHILVSLLFFYQISNFRAFFKAIFENFQCFLPFGYCLNSYENIFTKLNSAVTLVLLYERLVSRLFIFTQSLNN